MWLQNVFDQRVKGVRFVLTQVETWRKDVTKSNVQRLVGSVASDLIKSRNRSRCEKNTERFASSRQWQPLGCLYSGKTMYL